jgi:hypothetical protein
MLKAKGTLLGQCFSDFFARIPLSDFHASPVRRY